MKANLYYSTLSDTLQVDIPVRELPRKMQVNIFMALFHEMGLDALVQLPGAGEVFAELDNHLNRYLKSTPPSTEENNNG